MTLCLVCGGERGEKFAHSTCSVDCRREYERLYRARAVYAKCSICEDWRFTTYNEYSRQLTMRGGACPDCKGRGDRTKAEYVNVTPADDCDDIEFKPLACGTCEHAKLEKASFTGYSCALNAAYCQPRLAQRLYVRAKMSKV